jgi:hypothetical protein
MLDACPADGQNPVEIIATARSFNSDNILAKPTPTHGETKDEKRSD